MGVGDDGGDDKSDDDGYDDDGDYDDEDSDDIVAVADDDGEDFLASQVYAVLLSIFLDWDPVLHLSFVVCNGKFRQSIERLVKRSKPLLGSWEEEEESTLSMTKKNYYCSRRRAAPEASSFSRKGLQLTKPAFLYSCYYLT